MTFTDDQLRRAQDLARAQVGRPYEWGGIGPSGFDCSGFTDRVLHPERYPAARSTWKQRLRWHVHALRARAIDHAIALLERAR